MIHYLEPAVCQCGKAHTAAIDDVIIGSGAVGRLPEILKKYHSKKPFILADKNTFAAAGELVCQQVKDCCRYVFSQDCLEPNEESVGSAVMHFDNSCDLIIGIGSGVINDIGKILSNVTGRRYVIVATAPSMDGYASATSSMSVDGLKVSLNSRCADVIIGDTDILKNAPLHMLKAGLGDMLAKYVSIAEWRIAHIITGEYYCDKVAQLIRNALSRCVENTSGLLKREDKAIEAVFEGLVIGGVAMAYAGISRPASGVEHYFSHIWDMRGLTFGTQVDLHGIQCAIATLQAVKLYETVKKMKPDKNKAETYVKEFSYDIWSNRLRQFLGRSGETMIAQEEREGKYNKDTHPARMAKITENWEPIIAVLNEELPSSAEIEKLLQSIDISTDLQDFGIDRNTLMMTFHASKDIRDKYVLSRLAWDIGIIDELCLQL